MVVDERDVILKGLRDIEPGFGAQLALQLMDVEIHSPRLSEADTDAIAEKVAARLTEFAQRSKAPEALAWKSRLKKIVYDLAMGVSGSALYAVIEYLAHKAPVLFAGPDETSTSRDQGKPNREAILNQIQDAEARKTIKSVLDDAWLQEAIEREARKQLGTQPDFVEFTQVLNHANKSNNVVFPDIEDYLLRSISDPVFDKIIATAQERGQDP